MNETEVGEFWNSHPCGDHIVGGLHGEFGDDYERFFATYDAWRYDQERHIPASPISTPADLVDDPQLVARGFLRDMDHPAPEPMPAA